MSLYRFCWPFLRLLPPDWAHALGLKALKLPFRWAETITDSISWNGLTFRNRIGIAAGFDKDASALPGLERLGVGFVEIGTILIAPWPGNPDRPCLKRLIGEKAIWNRLGFPSQGLEQVERNLSRFPISARRGMLVGCNIGPHPGHLRAATNPMQYLEIARQELLQLVTRLHPHADFFVVNLSSPNTVGLRGMLLDRRLAADLLAPLKRELELLNKASSRPRTTPILLKLPPEDPERIPWKYDALELILRPVLDERACDGFVAVNTSTVLTQQLLGLDAGGVSGQPLLPIAIDSVKLLRSIVGPQPLIIGCGGVVKPADALALAAAGAELVELYSGMIYAGPGLPARCAAEMKRNSSRATNR